jgi:gliding motility-associated-like protein
LSLTVNPTTGVISGSPPALGQYVVGVKVDEYRNGVLINTVYRDFQFNVLNCPPIPFPGIAPVTGCSGLAINFTNTSVPLTGNSFYWDFGDPSSTTDNSTAVNPSYAYPSIGTYIVMLVAQAGTPCADTIYDTLTVSGVAPDFTYTDSVCVNVPVTFNDISVPTANATVNSWNWDFGDGAGVAVIPSPTYTYTTPGTYNVQLISGTNTGCFDSISKAIYVQALPQAFAVDTFACLSNPVTNLNGSVIGAGGGIWIGAGGFSLSNTDLNAAYTPTAAEITAGFSTLILSTTSNGFCPAVSDTMTLSFTVGITATVGGDISVCKGIDSIPLSGTIITASGGQWVSSGTGGSFFPNPFDLNATYLPSSSDTAAGSVDIYLNSVGNGNCVPDSDTLTIVFTTAPTVSILSNDTACSGSVLVNVSATSTTGSGYWQTLGTGTFTPSDSLNNTGYVASNGDNTLGTVTLIFTSTNNGGCNSYADTLDIALIPAPTPMFSFVSVCPTDTVFFTDLSTSVDPITSYTWDFGDGNGDNNQNTSNPYDTAGTYNVVLTVTSANGCVDSLSQSVLIYSLPIANFNVNGVCEGVNSLFIDSSTVNGSTINNWNWTFGDGGFGSIQNPIYTYVNSGSYNVNLIVQSAQGCSDTITKTITIQGPPTAAFSSAPSSVKVGEDFSFTDLSFANIASWDWDFGDTLGTSTSQNPLYSYDEKGNYVVCLSVTDLLGCKDSVCQEVIVFMPPVVPNAFSPNGEGQNNLFNVLGGPYKQLEFRIYNNWGEIIFESDDQAKGWDGTRDGIDQPIGVYVFTVRATTLDDVKHSLKGDVTLLR